MRLDRAKRVSESQYSDGDLFGSFAELCSWILAGKTLRISGHTRNAAFARNQQLHTLNRMFLTRSVRKAVFNPTNAEQLRERLKRQLAEVEAHLAKENDIPW